jgi:carbonic anhydrase
MFDDLLAANRAFHQRFSDPGLEGRAARGLAVLTCIDSRIDPLAMLGLAPGDAKILRNAGARVTSDALRSLVLAVNLLDVRRICVVQHTDCALASTSEDVVRARIGDALGVTVSTWDFLTMHDQIPALRDDLRRIVECDLIPDGVEVGGFVYDVKTGLLEAIDHDAG